MTAPAAYTVVARVLPCRACGAASYRPCVSSSQHPHRAGVHSLRRFDAQSLVAALGRSGMVIAFAPPGMLKEDERMTLRRQLLAMGVSPGRWTNARMRFEIEKRSAPPDDA